MRIKHWNRVKTIQIFFNEKNGEILCSANSLRIHYGEKIYKYGKGLDISER